jgi:hypothetical protein
MPGTGGKSLYLGTNLPAAMKVDLLSLSASDAGPGMLNDEFYASGDNTSAAG